MKRREFIKTIGLGVASVGALRASSLFAAKTPQPKGVGMCDWTMGGLADPEIISKAAQAHLSGIQISIGGTPDCIPLRSQKVRQRYLELSKKHNVTIHSVAAGRILNNIPLKSEPQSAVYVIDAIEAAAALGSSNILMAFFGKGDLRKTDNDGKFNDLKDGSFSSYELDQAGVDRVVKALRQIIPRAEDANVIMGLENTLTAKQNLSIIEQVGSPLLQVYYDMGNSTHYGYDVPTEIKLLGKKRICEMHIKDRGTKVFGGKQGEVDMKAVAKALQDIQYEKWMCLETAGGKGKFIEDTRANVAFSKRTFGIV
ncbi:MAG: TIM barrel protein [Kiritimatiellae bacterium]|jgi:L-ribulose-5-phosphate 3-epimerase|nr:TIM barrel protein [Kiritimatiellia bacterium]